MSFLRNWLNFAAVLISSATLLAVTGCANPTSFQTPSTLQQGDHREGAALTYASYQLALEEGAEPQYQSIPGFAAWARYGFTDRLEGSTYGWFPLGVKAGLKYQLVGHDTVGGPEVSLGGDLGYSAMALHDDEGDLSGLAHSFDVYVPVYTGIEFNEYISAYLTPQYVFRFAPEADYDRVGHQGLATLGFSAGGVNTRFFLEATGGYDTSLNSPIFGAGIGLEATSDLDWL